MWGIQNRQHRILEAENKESPKFGLCFVINSEIVLIFLSRIGWSSRQFPLQYVVLRGATIELSVLRLPSGEILTLVAPHSLVLLIQVKPHRLLEEKSTRGGENQCPVSVSVPISSTVEAAYTIAFTIQNIEAIPAGLGEVNGFYHNFRLISHTSRHLRQQERRPTARLKVQPVSSGNRSCFTTMVKFPSPPETIVGPRRFHNSRLSSMSSDWKVRDDFFVFSALQVFAHDLNFSSQVAKHMVSWGVLSTADRQGASHSSFS
jgi:hypothetical protein